MFLSELKCLFVLDWGRFGRFPGMCVRSTPWSSTTRAMYSPGHPCGLLDIFSYPRFSFVARRSLRRLSLHVDSFDPTIPPTICQTETDR